MSHNFSTGSQLPQDSPDQPLLVPIKRRSFFMYAGATAGATALVLAGCKKDDNNNPAVTDVGSGDFGVLNYAYALEQLESAFYARVLTSSYFTGSTATTADKQVFNDLALHEKIHADFFKTALGTKAIRSLTPDFSKIDFTTRSGVLSAAMAFEDLGVAAYNGAGKYIVTVDYLTLAGKIVSVEARHAALIRDMITYNSFVGIQSGTSFTSDILDPTTRMEIAKTPAQVLAVANTFLAEGSKVSANSLV